MPAMDMWAAGVLLCSCPEVMLAFESKRLPCGEPPCGFLASLAPCRLPFYMLLLDLRYLLFTGDCPIQQEDMQKLATKGPAGKDLVLKAAFVESEFFKCKTKHSANRRGVHARLWKPTS